MIDRGSLSKLVLLPTGLVFNESELQREAGRSNLSGDTQLEPHIKASSSLTLQTRVTFSNLSLQYLYG